MKTIYSYHYTKLIHVLRSRRLELGLTQEQVAVELHVSRTWIGKVEQRERRLDLLETWHLCRLYGIPFSEIENILSSDVKRP